jgi:serine protease Do
MSGIIRLFAIGLLIGTSQLSVATDFSQLFTQVSGSVVTITSSSYVEELTENGVTNSQHGETGSGVIVGSDGMVLTAAHVVNLADKLVAHLSNGRSYPARTISSFPFADLAVIQIIDPPTNLPVASMGDSNELAIGEEVIVIGAPYGFSQTLTVGHFSGRPQNTGSFNVMDTEFLQTDAPINPGNSGGPMFNTRGQVVGIVSHFRTNANGLGFVASINMAKDLFLNNGDIWAGMSVEPMNSTLARALNSPYPNGVLVQDIAEGSLAAGLGLRGSLIPATIDGKKLKLGGDIIIAIGGEPLSLTADGIEKAYAYLASRKSGEHVEMVVFRDGEQHRLTAPKP